jgi:hypothetical protein
MAENGRLRHPCVTLTADSMALRPTLQALTPVEHLSTSEAGGSEWWRRTDLCGWTRSVEWHGGSPGDCPKSLDSEPFAFLSRNSSMIPVDARTFRTRPLDRGLMDAAAQRFIFRKWTPVRTAQP